MNYLIGKSFVDFLCKFTYLKLDYVRDMKAKVFIV